jgi:hypothetical protein
MDSGGIMTFQQSTPEWQTIGDDFYKKVFSDAKKSKK